MNAENPPSKPTKPLKNGSFSTATTDPSLCNIEHEQHRSDNKFLALSTNDIETAVVAPPKPMKPLKNGSFSTATTDQPPDIEHEQHRSDSKFLALSTNDIETAVVASPIKTYESIIAVGDMDLFEIPPIAPRELVDHYQKRMKVSSRTYGIFWMLVDLLSIVLFLISFSKADKNTSFARFINLAYSNCVYYVLATVIAIPVWQNYSIVDTKEKELHCESSCLCWSCTSMCCSLLCCCGWFGCCGVRLRRRSVDDAATRYMPYSFYNYWFMIANPGKMLNQYLPNDLQYFGFGRAYLFLFSMNSKNSFNFFVFLHTLFNVIHLCSNGAASDSLSIILGICNLICTLASEAHGYVVKVVLGTFLFPFNIILFFASFLPACCWRSCLETQLMKGSCTYMVLGKLWRICSNE